MITEQGVVVAVEDHEVIVEVLKTSACKSCAAKQGCGQAVLAEWGEADKQQKKNHFKIPYHGTANIGDQVELGMAQDTISKVAFVVYIVPLILSFFGLLIAQQFTESELLQMMSMILFFGLSFFLLSQFKFNNLSVLEPKIIRLSRPSKGADIIASSTANSL